MCVSGLPIYIVGQKALSLSYVVVHSFPFWLVLSGAEIKCTTHVSLPKWPINLFKLNQQSRQQTLRVYCTIIHIQCWASNIIIAICSTFQMPKAFQMQLQMLFFTLSSTKAQLWLQTFLTILYKIFSSHYLLKAVTQIVPWNHSRINGFVVVFSLKSLPQNSWHQPHFSLLS